MKECKHIHTLKGHKFEIKSLQFIGDNKEKLISGSTTDEGHLYIWDIKNNHEKIGRFNAPGNIFEVFRNSSN